MGWMSNLPCFSVLKDEDADDSNVDAVIARNLWKNHRILPPTSKFKSNWDLMMMILVFYNCVYIPIELCFLAERDDYSKGVTHEVVDYIIDFLFFVDVCLNLRTAYYDSDYEMVLDPKQIFLNYRKFWFWIDAVAVIPFELILKLILQGDSSQFGSIFGMFKLPRLLRLLRVFKKLDVVAAANALRIFALLLMFLLFAHWFACCWWLIGWFEFVGDLKEATASGLPADTTKGVSWLQRIPGQTLTNSSSFGHQYLSSMYWSLTTLMKTPWVGPDTVAEKVFASVAVVIGAVLFAALLGNVTALMQTFNKANTQRREKITSLMGFAASRKCPAVLQKKLVNYVDAEWNFTNGLDDASVLAQLPSQLRGNIVASIYKDTLLTVPLFSCCSLECAKALLLRLRPQICLQKEVLIGRDQICQEMFVLMKGAIQVASSEVEGMGGKGRVALKFKMIEKSGAIVGHVDPFEREVPRYPFLVTAVRQSHLVSLTRVDVLQVLSNFKGEDCDNVLEVLRTEHKATVSQLTDKRASRVQAVANADETDEPSYAAAPKASTNGPSEYTLYTLRSRVTAMEQRLSACVDEMQAARECTEVLPQLVYLVNNASNAANGGLNG